ncbi:predicted protein [Lichtheimia corymbifera JMRC:FSU:9682]|uniref:Uncharacterized protein n=1 Tax=Lichtheimia corymbifera JMRC:FSU:9682 TaxID=1263082 RepID=A0A068S6R2_9FUNG|nr:predicted protein [Lichtheimia corymbifera JMRC:FSU:9682]
MHPLTEGFKARYIYISHLSSREVLLVCQGDKAMAYLIRILDLNKQPAGKTGLTFAPCLLRHQSASFIVAAIVILDSYDELSLREASAKVGLGANHGLHLVPELTWCK